MATANRRSLSTCFKVSCMNSEYRLRGPLGWSLLHRIYSRQCLAEQAKKLRTLYINDADQTGRLSYPREFSVNCPLGAGAWQFRHELRCSGTSCVVPARAALLRHELRCSGASCVAPARAALLRRELRCSGASCVAPARAALLRRELRCSGASCVVPARAVLFRHEQRSSGTSCVAPARAALFRHELRCSGTSCVAPARAALLRRELRCSGANCVAPAPDQPRHHYDPARQGRTHGAAWRKYRRMIDLSAAGRAAHGTDGGSSPAANSMDVE